MTQYKDLNVKLFNLQLNKLQSLIEDGTEVTLNLSSNAVCESNDETIFPHKLLLTQKFQKFVNLLQMVYQLI